MGIMKITKRLVVDPFNAAKKYLVKETTEDREMNDEKSKKAMWHVHVAAKTLGFGAMKPIGFCGVFIYEEAKGDRFDVMTQTVCSLDTVNIKAVQLGMKALDSKIKNYYGLQEQAVRQDLKAENDQ